MLAAACASAQPYDFTALDRFLDSTMAGAAPGGFVLTLAQNGAPIYQRSRNGFEPGRQVYVASACKWYTAAAVVALAAEGTLSLEDTVGRYFPGASAGARPATLRQLLNHTSGLQDPLGCVGQTSMTLAQCVDTIVASPVRFAPGSAFAYGGASYNTAGRMAELAAGKTWDAIFDEKIARPLGFACTSFNGNGSVSYPSLSGAAQSCGEDYTRFLEMMLQRGVFRGRRVLPAAAVTQMQTDQTGGLPVLDSPFWSLAASSSRAFAVPYGLGLWRERQDDADGLASDFSSLGGLGFSPWIDQERNLTGVLSMQGNWTQVVPAYLQMKEIIRGIVPSAPLRHTGIKNAASKLPSAVVPGILLEVTGPGVDGASRVLFGSQPGRLIAASAGRALVVAPAVAPDGVSVQVEVESGTGRTPAITVPVEDASPGLFAEILNQDETLNSVRLPARPGDVVVLYGTGAARSLPAAVEIDGQAADVLDFGPAPDTLPGGFQMRVRVPAGARPGLRVPVRVRVGRAESNAITLAVR